MPWKMTTSYLKHLQEVHGPSTELYVGSSHDATFNPANFMTTHANAYLDMPHPRNLATLSAAFSAAQGGQQGQDLSVLASAPVLVAAVQAVLDKLALVLDPDIIKEMGKLHVAGLAMLSKALRKRDGAEHDLSTVLCKPFHTKTVRKKKKPGMQDWEHHWCHLDKQGYLLIQLGKDARGKSGVVVRAHRFICWAFHGKPPDVKPQVRHTCHSKACLNPAHMRWGDAEENAADHKRARRARQQPGPAAAPCMTWVRDPDRVLDRVPGAPPLGCKSEPSPTFGSHKGGPAGICANFTRHFLAAGTTSSLPPRPSALWPSFGLSNEARKM